MATKSNVATIKDVKSGITLYKVYSLGAASFIESRLVMSKPYQHESGLGLFADYKNHYTGVNDNFSLSDCGIIANRYNTHKTFVTLNAAKRYLQAVNTGSNPHDEADSFGYDDDYGYEYLYGDDQ